MFFSFVKLLKTKTSKKKRERVRKGVSRQAGRNYSWRLIDSGEGGEGPQYKIGPRTPRVIQVLEDVLGPHQTSISGELSAKEVVLPVELSS